jgi:hypothetical protein
MPVTLITPQMLANIGIARLRSATLTYPLFRAQAIEGQFAGPTAIGDTVKVVLPGLGNVRDFGRTGAASPSDLSELPIDLVMEKKFFDQKELASRVATFDLQSVTEQLLFPMIDSMAENVCAYIASKFRLFPRWVGDITAPAVPTSVAEVKEINRTLSNFKTPKPNRNAILDPDGYTEVAAISEFVEADKRGKTVTMDEAELLRVQGLTWFEDQAVSATWDDGFQNNYHTSGTMGAATPAVNGAVVAGAKVMNVDGGIGVETILSGDRFTVANVVDNKGNPVQFVFTNDTTAVGGAITGATFTPAAPTGGFADDALLTMSVDHTVNFAWHPGALIACVVPPKNVNPNDPEAAIAFDPQTGMGLQVIMHGYSSTTLGKEISIATFAGAVPVREEYGVVILGE